MYLRQHRPRRPHGRAGLAPLELVLSLPLLLAVMGLMIVFGTAGAWKVRTLANSRQAVWRTFWPRTGDNDRHPRGWPRSAEMEARDASPSLFSSDPFAGFEVARGPAVTDPQTGMSLRVRKDVFDMTAGLRDGFARIERDFPLLKEMPPGRVDFPRHHVVLSLTRWQFPTMRISSNVTRRIPFLYPLELGAIVPELAERFTTAAIAIFFNPHRPDLLPLEGGDPEVRELLGRHSPDFQPKIPLGSERSTIAALEGRRLRPTYCDADPVIVHTDRVNELTNDIRRVPHRMVGYYIGVYQTVINRLGQSQPPVAGAEQMIQELQQKINQLNQFRATLPP